MRVKAGDYFCEDHRTVHLLDPNQAHRTAGKGLLVKLLVASVVTL